MSATAVCRHDGHVFSPLSDSWEPDDATPCDCGAISWAEHVRVGLRASVDASLAREGATRRRPTAPGPNPEMCNAPHPTKGVCGGPMSQAVKGRRTGFWMRTCCTCQATTGTLDPPANVGDRGPIVYAYPGELPMSGFETLT
jgi:hypothetical protein